MVLPGPDYDMEIGIVAASAGHVDSSVVNTGTYSLGAQWFIIHAVAIRA